MSKGQAARACRCREGGRNGVVVIAWVQVSQASQKVTVAAMEMAELKVCAHRS